MYKYLFPLLLFISANAMATNTFDATTGILNLDAVIYNNTKYTNVVMKLTGYTVISTGSTGTVAASCPSSAAIDTFDSSTNILNLNQVQYNNIQYNDVVLKLTGYDVQSIGASAPLSPTTPPVTPPVDSGTCSSENFTVAKFNAITVGMTVDQVNQTIGCKYDPSHTSASASFVSHNWYYKSQNSVQQIILYFDASDSVVTPLGGYGSNIKLRVGW